MSYETLIVERRGAVGWLVFDRPDSGNAMNAQMMRELERVVDAEPADAVDATRARARHHLPLARQRRVRDLPADADRADALRVGHHRVRKENLVEVDVAADVA